MKTFLLLAITTFLVFFALSCKKTNPTEPVYQNRIIVGDWRDTTSNGIINPNDSMSVSISPGISVEVEKSLVNGSIFVSVLDVTTKDTVFYQFNRGNGNYFLMGLLRISHGGNYIAYGYVLNPDTLWLKPQSFKLYLP